MFCTTCRSAGTAWFGTQSMPAHPYFFPSYRAMKQKTKQKIGAQLAAVYRKANRQKPVSTPTEAEAA